MHLQENTLYESDIGVKYPPHQMTCVPAKFEVDTSNSLREYAYTRKTLFDLDIGFKVI